MVSASTVEWLSGFARQLGVEPPSDDDCDAILALASVVAHASERKAAPIACWLAAQAGVSANDARELAMTIEILESDDSTSA